MIENTQAYNHNPIKNFKLEVLKNNLMKSELWFFTKFITEI